MALAEITPQQTLSAVEIFGPCPNPYDCSSERLQEYTDDLVANSKPFISTETNPSIDKDLSVFVLHGTDPRSNIARSIEGRVFLNDWGMPTETILEDMRPYEDNSGFFILVKTTDKEKPKAIGALRVAISTEAGMPLESRDFYTTSHDAKHPGEPIPEAIASELEFKDNESKLWDVVGVAVEKTDRRYGKSAAWLYHGLYAMSQLEYVDRWLANIHTDELKTLHALGIPFEQIPESETVSLTFPPRGEKPPKVLDFTFSVCDPDAIRVSMEKEIAKLETKEGDESASRLNLFLAMLARIALDGQTL